MLIGCQLPLLFLPLKERSFDLSRMSLALVCEVGVTSRTLQMEPGQEGRRGTVG
jgi:hypothetical protein